MLGVVVVAPVIVEVAVTLLLVLTCLIALGFLFVYRATIKWLVIQLADAMDRVSVGAFGRSVKLLAPIAGFLRNAAEAVDDGLARTVDATSGGIVYLLSLARRQLMAAVNWCAAFADTVAKELRTLALGDLPRALRATEALVARRLGALAHRIALAERTTAAAIAAAGAAIDYRLDWTGRRANTAIRRIARIERLTLTAAFAGVVATALARLGMGWLGCRNVKRIGRRACGLDPRYLDSLIADSLLFFGTFSLVQFAHEMQELTDEAAHAIRALTRQV